MSIHEHWQIDSASRAAVWLLKESREIHRAQSYAANEAPSSLFLVKARNRKPHVKEYPPGVEALARRHCTSSVTNEARPYPYS